MLDNDHHSNKETWQAIGSGSAKKVVYGILIGIFSYVVSYGSSVIIARVLGAKILGDYASTVSALSMIAGISLLGADSGLGRFIPNYLKNKDYSGVSGYIRYYGKWNLWIDAIIFILGIVAVLTLYFLTGEHILNIKYTHPFYFFIWGVPLLALFGYLAKFIRASGHGNAYLFISTALRPLLSLIFLCVFLIFIRAFTIPETLVIYFLAVLCSATIALIFSYFKTAFSVVKKNLPRYESLSWKPVIYQLFFLNIATSYYSTILLLSLSWLDKIAKTPGYIAAVFSISQLMWVINGSVCAITSPSITVAVTNKDKKQITSLLLTGVIANGLINGFIFLIIAFWGKEWLRHFGGDFTEAYSMLLVISFSILIATTASPLSWIFQQSDKLKEYTYFSLISLMVYIFSCCLVSYFLGGIAIAFVYGGMKIVSVIYLIVLAIRSWNHPEFMKVT